MPDLKLSDYQLKAVNELTNGKILCGGVGSGKSRTALYWYFRMLGGDIRDNKYFPMTEPKDLYIITTAKKRDTGDWYNEAIPFCLLPEAGYYSIKFVVDSWNNIGKYKDVTNSVFIFDEQRVVGSGPWVDSFLKITKSNTWILLSATPGDKWIDYLPVFLANGFFRNKTDFYSQHVIKPYGYRSYKIDYIRTGRLERLRSLILVIMDYDPPNERIDIWKDCEYNSIIYKDVMRSRWDIFKDTPIENAAGLCYVLRRVVGTDASRLESVGQIIKDRQRVIIFYNYDYELEALRAYLTSMQIEFTEWNSHKHQDIPYSKSWAYLVQYNACEGWECTTTDTMIFYSLSYSYKTMEQAKGRIDRRNTQFHKLYYYYLKTHSPIDISIMRALKNKKTFNENAFVRNSYKKGD